MLIFATGKRALPYCALYIFQLVTGSTMEVDTDWKSPQIFVFMDLKLGIKLAKK